MEPMHICLLSAMPEEIGEALLHLDNIQTKTFGDFKLYCGIYNKDNNQTPVYITLAWSGWGKVSAARAVTRIISSSFYRIPIKLILFTGVAGGVNKNLKQWDIVLPDSLIQYDLDARPIFDKFVIPSLKISKLKPKKKIHELIYSGLVKAKNNNKLINFGKINKGLIGTGDQFIANNSDLKKLINDIPNLDAVEMEGASVAQVATQENIEWIIIRVISDNANESAALSFTQFLKQYKKHSWQLVKEILNSL